MEAQSWFISAAVSPSSSFSNGKYNALLLENDGPIQQIVNKENKIRRNLISHSTQNLHELFITLHKFINWKRVDINFDSYNIPWITMTRHRVLLVFIIRRSVGLNF